MSDTSALKTSIISRIKKSDDLDLLKALQTILDSMEKELFELSPEQEKAIEQSRKQLENGDSHNNKELISEMRKWLEKK
ncbi:MAG TPA: hypothetical protein VJ949_05905 [Cryomorphaceae bacterium]|nr:hypothetical protein [Cryomorphaceae bacterium]